MARQVGEIAITGTIGNMNYYYYKGEIIGRRKSTLTKAKVMSMPSMDGSRKSMSEMGRASNGGKLLRHAIYHLLVSCQDTEAHNRLTSVMRRVINSDGINEMGSREVNNGNLQLVNGFNFNIDCGLENLFFGSSVIKVNRKAGVASIDVSNFLIKEYLRMPKAATHFQFVGAMVEIDFGGQETKRNFAESEFISCEEVESGDISMVFKNEKNSLLPMFFILGVHFYQGINGVMEKLTERVFNALQVVGVDEG